ncbi:MAG TPA: potassium-transporting ATPase subunit KdpC [Actinomycetota bacterium]
MGRAIVSALRMLLVLTVVVGVLYPLAVWGVGRVAFSDRADGSLLSRDGEVVGSSLIGQAFEGPGWFIGRPDAFDPAASAPSNLGPTNPELGAAVSERLDSIKSSDGASEVPVDAVTGSGSGLDPHISPAYARLQAPRVAEARGLEVSDVMALIDEHTEGRTFGFLGEPRVNVLRLNLALEELAPLP